MPAPMPVLMVRKMKSLHPRPAPKNHSASAAQFASFSNVPGMPRLSSKYLRIGTLRQNLLFVGAVMTPLTGSAGYGLETPNAAMSDSFRPALSISCLETFSVS